MQSGLKVFSTCPQSRDLDPDRYPQAVRDSARWSEAAGCEGMLVYTDNGVIDPWLVAHLVIQSTNRLSPLVAVQPIYMHPYSVAKLVSSLAYLHGRRVYLNMVAGGFRNDLIALGDTTPHDERYARLLEYGQVIRALVAGQGPTSFDGHYYAAQNLRLVPPVPPDCVPRMMLSGSSAAGLAAAKVLGAIAIKYPQPAANEEPQEHDLQMGMRIGIISREDAEGAWSEAYRRFPEDRRGQLAHGLAMQSSDSEWHRRLRELARTAALQNQPYWLGPFENYKTFCPYLVGDHDQVHNELTRYMGLGFSTFVLDIPPAEEELQTTTAVLRRAWNTVVS
jgi:alkanesulfonate monooxygenase